MNLQIAQISKNTFSNYMIEQKTSVLKSVIFKTTATSSNFTISEGALCFRDGSNFKTNQGYCFKNIQVGLRGTNNKRVKIKLINDIGDIGQTIDIITVPGNLTFTLSFVPKQDFKYILFELHRTDLSLYKESIYATSDRQGRFFEVNNILNNLKSKFSLKSIQQLGIQGVNGFQFIINGELIRLGKSGIYTASNIDFNFLGFIVLEEEDSNPDIPIPLNESANYFLMDFIYEEEGV